MQCDIRCQPQKKYAQIMSENLGVLMVTGIETALASAAIKESTPAARLLGRIGKSKYDRFIAKYTKAFNDHVKDSVQKASRVKNILYKDQSASTDDKYVNTNFKCNGNPISDTELLNSIILGKRLIVMGTGGAGKTMFTKWSVLRIAESISVHQLVPIYIDLRDVSEKDDISDFAATLFNKVSKVRGGATFGQFLEGLKDGIFVVMLDAADEIRKSIRADVIKAIVKFSKEYGRCGMLVTSREIGELDGITEFDVVQTCPLTMEQVVEVVNKLDYDTDVKNHLVKEIEGGLYKTHEGFLSNPLMATIMLLTYDQSKSIPTKRSTFYKRAFEALYERHDSAKGIYRRDHHAGLPMDEFERIFATFCYGTYVNSRFEFLETELIRFFRESGKMCGITENPEQISRDAIESVCLIQKEGHEYVFSHRLFQEYFTALYIKLYRKPDIGAIIGDALRRGRGENVGVLLYEMDQESLELNYVIPALRKVNRTISKFNLKDASDVVKMFNLFMSHLRINLDKFSVRHLKPRVNANVNFLMSVVGLYPEADWYSRFFGEGDNAILKDFSKLSGNKSLSSKQFNNLRIKYLRSEDHFDLYLNDDSITWIMETTIPIKLEEIRSELSNLERRIGSGETDSSSSSSFINFSRNYA